MRRPGFTLIEVIVALALIATTGTLLLTAQSRALGRVRAIRHQETAARIAHELLAAWRLRPHEKTAHAEGDVADEPGWSWRRRETHSDRTRFLQTVEVTLTVYRRDELGDVVAMATYTWLERVDDREKN